jgi:hypothetical protein
LSSIIFVISRFYYGQTTGKIKTLSQKGSRECPLLIRSQIFKHQNKFKKLWAFEDFSAIIFVISIIYGHTLLVLNTKMKTKSQKVQYNVLFYLGAKYSNTKINFKSYEHLKFFLPTFLWLKYFTVTQQASYSTPKWKFSPRRFKGLYSIT